MRKLIPEVRFPEFSGEWEVEKVGALCDSIVPGRNKPTNFEGNIPWITTPDIVHNGIISISKKGLNISREEAKKVGSKIVPINSVIISCVGDLGLSAISGKEIIINQQLHAFIPKEKLEYRFLLYQLNLKKKYMDTVATKTAVPYMNKDNCNSIPINFPSLPEQTKIASFLTTVDEKLTALNQKKTLLEQYKKGVMQQIFSQELRFKDDTSASLSTGSGNDYADWEEKKLGEVCEIIGGGTPETAKEEYWNGNIQWFTPTEIKSDFVSKSVRRITSLGLQKSSAKILPIGTILLTTRATIGEVSIANEVCCTNQGFQSLVAKKYTNNIYIFNWIKENKFELIKRANGSTFPEISKSEIQEIQIPFPSLPEQTKIANFLSAIDVKINHCQEQIDQTTIWKKGLLQQLFV